METRRRFLKASAAAAVVSRSVLGANDRIQMAIIGTGMRGNQVYGSFSQHKDQVFVAACDVARDRLDQFATRAGKVDTYTDYRKVLDRKDIDAVLITTPDHWHAPMLAAACQAGKDAYVEKPISNTIEAAKQMVEVVHKYNRVCQVGVQQRSWKHFQECAKLVREGYIGPISHLVMAYTGSYTQAPQATQTPPETLDWDGFQGAAPQHPFKPGRLRWRAFYDYGGGIITDWGVHLVDVANWYMDADQKAPLLTAAAGQYSRFENPEHDQLPDSVQVVWTFDKYTASFVNMNIFPTAQGELPLQGNFFYGTKGVMLVNRTGYQIRANTQRPVARVPMPGMTAPPPAAPPEPPIEAKSYLEPPRSQNAETPGSAFDAATVAHTRNFLDCVKSRQTPVASIDVGFHSTLPCLLGVLAVRQGKTFAWDPQTQTAKAV